MSKLSFIMSAILITFFLLFPFPDFTYAQQIGVSGTVQSIDGLALNGKIEVYQEDSLVQKTEANLDGQFLINLDSGSYTLIVWFDDPATNGHDYLPIKKDVKVPANNLVFQLTPSASIYIEREIQIVETENLPISTLYEVMGKEVVEVGGFTLQYGLRSEGISNILDLEPRQIVIPINNDYLIRAKTTLLVDGNLKEYEFKTSTFSNLQKGDLVNFDIRKDSIPINFDIIENTKIELEARFFELEEKGFYLSKQRRSQSQAEVFIEDAKHLFNFDRLDDGYDSAKRGYLTLIHTGNELDSMFRDASSSVYVLIAFLAIFSITSGYMLTDTRFLRYVIDLPIFVISLLLLYVTYPGSKIVPSQSFILFSLICFIWFEFISTAIPVLWSSKKSDGHVRVRNLISPIFSIAKRNLLRRWLRFSLTLISLVLLVMGFVTLTSFSEGFGLVYGKQTNPLSNHGVLIKASGWTASDPSFLVWNEIEHDWLISRTGTEEISAKVENAPRKIPYFKINQQEIWGIIGITEKEADVLNLGNIIPVDSSSGVLVSEAIGLELGGIIPYGLTEYIVTGFFNERAFSMLLDLDGKPYSPMKWVNKAPEGENPVFVLEPCEPNEVLIFSFEEALMFIGTGVERVAIKVQEGNASSVAESLALERGYKSWASSLIGVQSFHLGNYYEGRGLSLIVPWVIVVLNVIITMLNNLFERKKDIEILSSVGLNPAQVSAIFVAEASITGFLAGGIGYLMGLFLYKGIDFLNFATQVQQKVSAVWSLAAIGLSISAVLTGAFVALRSSIVITPSLMRRWQIEDRRDSWTPWNLDIPIKLTHGEGRIFSKFMFDRLSSLEGGMEKHTSSIKYREEEGDFIIKFVYKSVQATTGNFFTMNNLIVSSTGEGNYKVELQSLGTQEWVHFVGSMIRRFTMEYSTKN